MATKKKQRSQNSRRNDIPDWGADFMSEYAGETNTVGISMRSKMNRMEISTEFPKGDFQTIMSGGASVITIFKGEDHRLHLIRAKGNVYDKDLMMEREERFLKLPGGKTQGSQLTDELFERSLRFMACGDGKDKGFGYSEEVFEVYLKKIKWHRASENQLSLLNALKRTAIYEHLEETGQLISELEFCSVVYKKNRGADDEKYPNFFFRVKEVYVQSSSGYLSQVTKLKPDMKASPFSKGSVVAMCVPRHASTVSSEITSPAHLLALETCLEEKLV